MMSELEDALETSIFVDIALPIEERRHQAKVVATLKEAAKLVANPNIEAALVVYRDSEYEGPTNRDEVRRIVAAALTPLGDDE